MPDMVMRRLAVVRFTTTSKDFTAIVRGPAGEKPKKKKTLKQGDSVPSTKAGLYTLEVRDPLLRKLSVTLRDISASPKSLPPTYIEPDDETVIISYQVF
jgi:hypothetical protein